MRSRHCFLGKLFQYLRPFSKLPSFRGIFQWCFSNISPERGSWQSQVWNNKELLQVWISVGPMSSGGPFLEEYGLPGGRIFPLLIFFSSEKKKSFMEVSLFLGSFTSFFFWGEHPSWRDLNKYLWISKYWLELYKSSIGWEWLEMVGKPLPGNFDNTHDFGEGWWRNFQASSGKPGVGSSFFPGKTTFF